MPPVASALSRLPHLPPPVLTAYLDTNPANPQNQSTPRGYITRLKSTARALEKNLPVQSRRQFRRELRRVMDYLNSRTVQARGTLLFAGPEAWEAIQLQVPIRDEIHWGKPSLQQLAWVMDEHRPRGAVLVDGSGARFFRFWLGEVTEDEEMQFLIDTSNWRKPYLVGPSTSGPSKRHGIQRDRVAARETAHKKRFASEVAKRIDRWASRETINPVVLVGEQRQIDAVAGALPEHSREQVAVLPKVLPRTSPSEVQRELEPLLRNWEREYEEKEVADLIDAYDPNRAVLGVDETLHQLQSGRVRQLVIVRNFRGMVRQCSKCGWVNRSADPLCMLCGSKRQSRTLRTVIPELASVFGVPMEIVAGTAAAKLQKHGGIAGWLGARQKSVQRVKVVTSSSKGKRSA